MGKNKITNEQVIDLYDKFKNYLLIHGTNIVHEKNITEIKNDIKNIIIDEKKFNWNNNSLSMYIHNLIYMIRGEGFGRIMNTFADNYLAESFCKDFGEPICSNVKKSLKEHKEYIADLNFKKQRQVQQDEKNQNKNLTEYSIQNIILYGVPGVGKTHNVNKLIRLIDEGQHIEEVFSVIRNSEKSNGQLSEELEERIEFVTFHQSFGYEDFIEGFRPDENGNIGLEDGVFKRLAQKAEKNLLESMKEHSFDIDTFLQDYSTYIEENDHTELEPGLTIKVKRNSEGEPQSFIVGGKIINQSLTKSVIARDFENFLNGKIKSYMDIKPSYNSKSIYHGNASNYFKLYQDMKRFMDRTGREKYFSKSEPLQNYYLVIDEINRGNISKIFGELITLIEEDKRDILEVTLPYSNSQEPFRVPSNLYIIGTMNSTDKSIALIDAALRRRFTFVKMEPNAALIDNEDAKKLFISLNEYLKKRLGEDYQIGHSYFMKVQSDGDLDFVIEYKIKPLLEEYFYGDNEGLNGALKILEGVGSEESEKR